MDGQINVRREPNDDAEIVGILYQDCAGELISEDGDWVQLVSGDVTGWARRDGFLFGEEGVAQCFPALRVNHASLNGRAANVISYQIHTLNVFLIIL